MEYHGWSYLSMSCFLVRIKAQSESSPRNELKDKTNDGDKMWTLLCRVSETIFASQHACALTESVGDRVFILMYLLSSCFLVIAGRSYCSVESLTQRRTSTWASWLWPNFPRAQRPGYIGKAADAIPAGNTRMFQAALFVWAGELFKLLRLLWSACMDS